MDVVGKKGHNIKKSVSNKSYEVPPRVESNEGLTSQEPSAIEASEDDVKVISKDVSLGREWVMKVNVGIDIVEIFSQCLGKAHGGMENYRCHKDKYRGLKEQVGAGMTEIDKNIVVTRESKIEAPTPAVLKEVHDAREVKKFLTLRELFQAWKALQVPSTAPHPRTVDGLTPRTAAPSLGSEAPPLPA
uniref:Uncharacterized protein n=1 Tax=Solanum tuberosum TaxID=4113 RepID=M1DAE2_SOLTU